MLEKFAKSFESVCEFGAVLNFIIFGGAGAYLGYRTNMILAIVLLIIGILIAFLLNVLTFGFIAQIIEIRKSLHSIDYMLSEAKFDTDIAEIKNTVSKIEEKIAK
ncbi:MAG: hypothetical protein J5527_09255 [Treponema sp.]|nr:hypothetical protein [Treponema sp.]